MMRISLIAGVLCLTISATLLMVFTVVACQQPNSSTKKCYEPTGSVADCTAWPGGACAGKSIYSINDFPDGTMSASSGTTAQEQDDCYQETPCRQKQQDPYQCETAPTLPYVLGNKTVSGADPCPEP
jgi:uncharacterized membrane protein